MLGKTLKYLFTYSERALTPKVYSSLVQESVKNLSLPEIMHNFYLYEHNVTVFDIDYFQRVAYSLLDFQKKMPVSDILTVLRLGMRHNVRNQMIWRHFQAELHRRLHSCMTPIFEAENKQYEENSNKMYQHLESQSQDCFQILTNQFTASQSKPGSVQTATSSGSAIPPTKDLTRKKSTHEITKFAYELVEILVWYNCENVRLINLLLQTQLHPLVLKNTPSAVIRSAELLVYALQVNMKEYQSNKSRYTARSIKKIYKFQGCYFPELVNRMKTCLGQFSSEEIRYFTDVIRSFPVKKREHRKIVVELLTAEWIKRGQGLLEQQKQKLEEILAKDHKLITKFRKNLEIKQEKGQALLESKEQSRNAEDK